MPCQYQGYSDQPFKCKLICVLLPLCSKRCFSFAVLQWLKFSFFLLKSSTEYLGFPISVMKLLSWHDATNQSWLMQRLNIVAGTRLYTGRRHRVSQAAFSREKSFRGFRTVQHKPASTTTKCLKLDIWDLRISATALFVK